MYAHLIRHMLMEKLGHFFVITCLISMMISPAMGGITPEKMETFKEVLQECKVQENAPDDIIGKLVSKQFVPEIKCFAACVMQKIGLMTLDNKINKEMALKEAHEIFEENPEMITKFEKIIEICGTLTDPDRCEAVHKIHTCMEEQKAKENIVMPY